MVSCTNGQSRNLRRGASRSVLAITISLGVLAAPDPARAWIWPEHRDIAAEALRRLPAGERKAIDAMWADAQGVAGSQICKNAVDPGSEPGPQTRDPAKVCVDLASFPALAADHSCSAGELWADASREPWVVKVVWVAARTKERLAEAKDEAQRVDAWNHSHLAMQYVDPRYLTRAEGNNAHFLVPRAQVRDHETLDVYVARVLQPSTEINAIGLYVEYHMLALRLAALWHAAPAAERPDLSRRAISAEGVALHFLEDSFSAGHYAATWGSGPWQKGTHDLYSTIGLATMTWNGELFASHGDGHMTEEDMTVAAATVRQSLAQLAIAANGRMPVGTGALTPEEDAVQALDFCKADHLPPVPPDRMARAASTMVLETTPVPAGGADTIHPPRARAEMGPFVGAISGYTLGVALGGYDSWANSRIRSEFEIGARAGYGLEGLLTSNMDGQIWLEGAFVADTVQLDLGCSTCNGGPREDVAVPRVSSRAALKLAVRMPYYVVPFDLILLAPTLLLVSPSSLQGVIFASASGGLLGLQRRIETGIGTFQFMAGREIGLTLWGFRGVTNQFIYTPSTDPAQARIVNYKSLEWDFPVLEYVPPRVFATSLAFAAQFQLGFSVEFPNDSQFKATGEPFSLGPSWLVYLRFRLDARKYFGGESD